MPTTQEIRDWLVANPGLIDAEISSAMKQYGVTADQMAAATGLSPLAVASRMGSSTPSSISFTPAPDSEGGQSRDSYAINGTPVNAIYGTVAGYGGDGPNAGAISGVSGFSGGIEHIGDRDYTAQYDASGKFLGYIPYAGESAFSSVVKPLLPIIASAIAPGLGEFIGGATGLTGANLAAATGATIGGGTAALTGQDVLKGAALGGLGGYAGSTLTDSLTDTGAIDTNGWDMTSAANYDAGLQGVGNNLDGLSDLELAQIYDQGMTGVGSKLDSSSDFELGDSDAALAAQYDSGLAGAGSNLSDAEFAAPFDATANEGTLAKSATKAGLLDGMSDLQKLAALQAGSALATKLTTPKMPQAATGFEYTSDSKPNYDIKFDDPVHWADINVPDFHVSDIVQSPYFTQSMTGQATGPMLNSGSDSYKSALIKGLRDASAMPAFVNPGFVNFATTK